MTNQKTKFYCQTCGHSFDTQEALLTHKRTASHHDLDMIHCDECDGYFDTEEAFLKHFHVSHLRQA